MALREILAQLDVRVAGGSSVTAMNAELDRVVGRVAPAGRAFENLRLAQMRASGTAAQLTTQIRRLEAAEGSNAAQLEVLRRRLVRAQEAARRFGERASRLHAQTQGATSSTGGLVAGLGRAGAVLAGIAAATAGARAAIGGLVGAFREILDLGDNLDKTAQQLGLATSQLQAWRFAADRAGVDARAMDQSFMRLQRAAFEAARGSSNYREAFERLGVSVRDGNGELLEADALMREMARGMSSLENETERVALAQLLMGRSGARLLPLLNDGEEGIAAMTERFEELGGGLSEDVVESSAEAQDALTDFRLAMTSLKGVLAANVLPAVTTVVSGIATLVGHFVEISQTSSAVQTALGALTVAVAGLTLVLLPAAAPFVLITAAMGLLFLAVEDVVTAFRGGESVIGTVVERMLEAMGVTVSFQGVLEAFGVAWDLMVADATEGVASLLEGLVRLQRAAGFEVSPEFTRGAVGARGEATSARGAATRSIRQLRENERARVRAANERDAIINAPPPPVVERQRRGSRSETPETRVHMPTTIQVNGAPDPEAVGRQIERHLRRRIREAAETQPLASEAT